MKPRLTISAVGELAMAEASEPRPKSTKPTWSAGPSAEAVPQAPGGQQQAGEHQGVRVDHPLQLRVGGVQLPHDGRQGHVEDRVVQHDDEEAEAQHSQDQPAPILGSGLDPLRQAHPTRGYGRSFRNATVSEVSRRRDPVLAGSLNPERLRGSPREPS